MAFEEWVGKHQRVLKGWTHTAKDLKENIAPVPSKLPQKVLQDAPAGIVDMSGKSSAA